MRKTLNQSGIIHTLPLLIIIAAIGIISFLLVTSTAPLGGLFGKLNPQPASHAQMMMTLQDDCKFYTDAPGTPVAFCDTFDTPHPGGRNGDLDDTRWQYSRIFGGGDNPFQGYVNPFGPMQAVRCQSIISGVLPDNDSFICGLDQPIPESNHWMEAFTNGAGADGAIIKEPFDFTNRTGVLAFDTDAKTAGGHTWWPVVCFNDKLYIGSGVAATYPKNGFCLHFGETTSQPSGITDLSQQPIGLGGMGSQDSSGLFVYTNYSNTAPGVNKDSSQGLAEYVTQPDHANHFEIRVNQNSIEVWASDKTDDGVNFPNFRRRFFWTGLNLPITRGYVSFGQTHYSPGKEGVVEPMTYHWHGIGFDGPAISPTVRGYDIPDAETAKDYDTCCSPGPLNLGYWLNQDGPHYVAKTPPYRYLTTFPPFQNVDLTGVTNAYLSANVWYVDNPAPVAAILYRFNGNTNPNAQWHTFPVPPELVNLGLVGGGPFLVAMPVNPQADLISGTNTLEMKSDGKNVDIANISLDLELGDVLPLASNHVITGMPSGSTMPSSMPSTTSSPTPSPSGSCPLGDLDGDCHVGIFDFNLLVGNFNKTGTGIQGDLDNNGKVDIFDFNTLIGNFGK